MSDITIRFPSYDERSPTVPIVFETDHVLDLKFSNGMTLGAITVVDSQRWLGAPAALGRPGAFNVFHDAGKDCVVVQFREGAGTDGRSREGDDVAVNDEPLLRLLWGPAEELEGIIIWRASHRIGDLSG